MGEEQNGNKGLNEDLRKVEAESTAKQTRHRVDEYIALILGLGSVLLLWFLQAVGLY
ncbi:MAG TPA: hypothetical protein VMT71_12000 [Syntrophorhabdales bacterium]|nr:hypothetical protein [Syntrophorhabdales bacterium]